MNNNLIMDCFFEYEGKIISLHIKNEKTKIYTIHSIEKMRGFLDFYDENGYCGTEAFCENFENMSPVKPHIAKKYYIQLINRNK